MSTPTFEQFEAAARARGCEEILARDWAPHQVLETHAHPFKASALVAKGEMWLTVGDETRHLLAGDTFELEPGEPHSERYGSEGAIYWVARS